ncbi:hypothetical protein NUU61_000158 [Penicillium alfredii]|uniref:Uncharacterized protein n=1 Tax=Penicillium alfredii TaxID=1506179 RepID=A0A9W9G926_9EURO|nr:uncharacterized protein NUU61_000158 [Penicillium alfredii]KAJ5114399.1 hypothetical protein NUU61_000158 [Penicillium alfredii]
MIEGLVLRSVCTAFLGSPEFDIHVRPEEVDIVQSTLAPSLVLYVGLETVAYGIAAATNRVEVKDWLWPVALVFTTYQRLFSPSTGLPCRTDLQKLLLSQVTTWGVLPFGSIARQSLLRGGENPRYHASK